MAFPATHSHESPAGGADPQVRGRPPGRPPGRDFRVSHHGRPWPPKVTKVTVASVRMEPRFVSERGV